MTIRSFHAPDRPPTVLQMRARVRDKIRQHRESAQRMRGRGRPDIAEMILHGDPARSIWATSRAEIRSEFLLYRAIHRAQIAHDKGRMLDRWAIWPDTERANPTDTPREKENPHD